MRASGTLLFLGALLLPNLALATVFTVGPGQQYQALSSAMSQAEDGDEIFLFPGATLPSSTIEVDIDLTLRGGSNETVEYTGAEPLLRVTNGSLLVEDLTWRTTGGALVAVDADGALTLRRVVFDGGGAAASPLDGMVNVRLGDALLEDVEARNGTTPFLESSRGTLRMERVHLHDFDLSSNSVLRTYDVQLDVLDSRLVGLRSNGVAAAAFLYETGAGLSEITFTDTVFEGNEGADHGAIIVRGPTVTFQRCSFRDNDGGVGGGGAIWTDAVSEVSILDSRFVGNEAGALGGALTVRGLASLTLRRSVFCDNFADGAGGAVAMVPQGSGTAPTTPPAYTLSHNWFVDNEGFSAGGAVYCNDNEEAVPDFDLHHNAFVGNHVFSTSSNNNASHAHNRGCDGVVTHNVFLEPRDASTPRESTQLHVLAGDEVRHNRLQGFPGDDVWPTTGPWPTGANNVEWSSSTALSDLFAYTPIAADLDTNPCGPWPLAESSPLLDAGDPALDDPDGTRADIGPWGGPDALPAWFQDADNDGWDAFEDCDDNNPQALPIANETCNGVDNDCDGQIDRTGSQAPAGATSWYRDVDGDGAGAGPPVLSCEPTATHTVDNDDDCFPNDPDRGPGATEFCNDVDDDCDGLLDEDDPTSLPAWYQDLDADGYGDPGTLRRQCEAPGPGWITVGGDCDDTTNNINPDAIELCDGIDGDCDGVVDNEPGEFGDAYYRDADGDGFGNEAAGVVYDCRAPEGYVDRDGDCNDFDEDYRPFAKESCGDDAVDYNCDGSVGDADADGDGTRACEDCNDLDASVYPGADDEPYDGVITDCDNEDDYDADNDGFRSADWGGEDCDDRSEEIYPGADDIPGNGVDEDCDGEDATADRDTDGGVDVTPQGCCAEDGDTSAAWLLLPLAVLGGRRRRDGRA